MDCKYCGTELYHTVLDLGHQPPSNALLTKEQLEDAEIHYPLKMFVCSKCLLAQVPEYKPASEIFVHNYSYHSSHSSTWVEHAKKYVNSVIDKFQLNVDSHVLEIGSNDGYLLQHFMNKRIPCLGIDPATTATGEAAKKGIPTISKFFTHKLAKNLPFFDLILGINVFAHVPNINDFIKGMRICLKPGGVITMEFQHLMPLMENCLYDTVYHEHYFYHSLFVLKDIFETHGMHIFDVDELPTHGGSLRIYVQHSNGKRLETKRVQEVIAKEKSAGMDNVKYYKGIQNRANLLRSHLMQTLYRLSGEKKIAGYGAAAKGNTLINYCGIKSDLIPFVVDASPFKQNLHLPGSHIRITDESELHQYKPDYIVIFAWNLTEEIMRQLKFAKKWGAKFIIPMPEVKII